MADLIPLDEVTELDEAKRKILAEEHWIVSVEELVSTVRSSEAALTDLAEVLGVSEDEMMEIYSAADALLPADTEFAVSAEIEVGEGLIFDDLPDLDEGAFSPPVDLPPEVPPLSSFPVQYQGKRNSCVAFTLAAIYQTLSNEPTDLSEQFLYWACKNRDGKPGDVGTSPLIGMQVLSELGVCSEATWPYKPEPVDQANPGHEKPTESAFEEAKRRRISGFRQLPKTDVNQIKGALAEGKPVLIGLFIYEHWSQAWQGRNLGKLRKHLLSEKRGGGHAMCVLGYRDDATAPGGGYFIVRNSWGPDWAKDNPDGPGYAHVPYQLVFEGGLAAFVADGVVPPPAPAPESLGGGSTVASTAPLGDLAGIYAEVQAIQAQVNSLATRLAAALGVSSTAAPAADVAATRKTLVPESASTQTVDAPKNSVSGPLILIKGKTSATLGGTADDPDDLAPNGLSRETGEPLLRIDAHTMAALAEGEEDRLEEKERKRRERLAKTKEDSQESNFGVVADVDPNSVEQSRWAIVVNELEDTAVIAALWSLIDHRMQQMGFANRNFKPAPGQTCGAWLSTWTDKGAKNLETHWGEIPPVLTYRNGLTVNNWLRNNSSGVGAVDPTRGVPYYLMLVGRPGPLKADDITYIPLNFQYELDIFWAVGRLCFTDMSGHHVFANYTRYAEQVVNFEQATDAANRLRKEVVYFGTKHKLDKSTIRSAEELITPLAQWHTRESSIATRGGYGQRLFLEKDATRSNLESLLRASDGKPPAVLFTASHGLGLLPNSADLVGHQGALVTQDWTGFGSINREHWFAGEDLKEAKVAGMLAFLFACYGAGCPQYDEFIFDEKRGPAQIAPFPFIAQLPQQLLLNGALGVLGHIERAWTYSFSNDKAKGQIQGFQDVLGRLLKGDRAGNATDQFNVIFGSRSAALTQTLEDNRYARYNGGEIDTAEVARLWMARNDARNYALLGDPAVKLPFPRVPDLESTH